MASLEVPMKPVLAVAATIVLFVALAIAVVFGLLRAWHSPAGGTAIHGAERSAAMARTGPALESAPQVDGTAYRAAKARELAASEAPR